VHENSCFELAVLDDLQIFWVAVGFQLLHLLLLL
jgi:hypothetical protein